MVVSVYISAYWHEFCPEEFVSAERAGSSPSLPVLAIGCRSHATACLVVLIGVLVFALQTLVYTTHVNTNRAVRDRLHSTVSYEAPRRKAWLVVVLHVLASLVCLAITFTWRLLPTSQISLQDAEQSKKHEELNLELLGSLALTKREIPLHLQAYTLEQAGTFLVGAVLEALERKGHAVPHSSLWFTGCAAMVALGVLSCDVLGRLLNQRQWKETLLIVEPANGYVCIIEYIVLGLWVMLGCVSLLQQKMHVANGVEDDRGIQEPLLSGEENSELEASTMNQDSLDVKRPGTYGGASMFSRLVFAWVESLLLQGYKLHYGPAGPQSLGLHDVPPIPATEAVQHNFGNWWRRWQLEPPAAPSVVTCSLSTFLTPFVFSGLMLLLSSLCQYAGPLILNEFVDFMSPNRRDDPVWIGYALCLALCASRTSQSLADHQYAFRTKILGLHLRSSLQAALYVKSLRISHASRLKYSTGDMVNLMAVDAQRLADCLPQIHNLWALPLQIAIAITILFRVVGAACVAGVGAIIFFIIVQWVVVRNVRRLQQLLLSAKDARMKVMAEVLCAIKMIKLHAWEEFFRGKVDARRSEELRILRRVTALNCFNIFLLWMSPLVVTVVTFAAWELGVSGLIKPAVITSAKAFTAIATFRQLQDPVRTFPTVIATIIMAFVSVRRIQRFLLSEELQPAAVERRAAVPTPTCPEDQPVQVVAVEVQGGEFSWDHSEVSSPHSHQSHSTDASLLSLPPSTLVDVNLRVGPGETLAVCGSVGCGKTSLLAALLGQIPRVAGRVMVAGRIAYVPQVAWIQNATIRDNVLFGKEFDESRYKATLQACSLEKDLPLLPAGDATEIGERGVNLSGGQKQRVQLARALYADADVYLLDDPLSAVDAHTSADLMQRYILGALQHKTVVLVTHAVEYLPALDQVVVLKGGRIVQAGKYEDLLDEGSTLQTLISAHNQGAERLTADQAASELTLEDCTQGSGRARKRRVKSGHYRGLEEEGASAFVPSRLSRVDTSEDRDDEGCLVVLGSRPEDNQTSLAGLEARGMEPHNSARGSDEQDARSGGANVPDCACDGQLVKNEEREVGQVSWAVYSTYFSNAGWYAIPVLILVQSSWQILRISSDTWLQRFTDGEMEGVSKHRFLLVYTALALGSGTTQLMRVVMVCFTGLQTAHGYYNSMMTSLLAAPLTFFESTPQGRILNRASADQNALDSDIYYQYGNVLTIGFQLIGVLVVITAILPIMTLFVVILLLWYCWIVRYYITTARELTRLESVTKSPVLHLFGESVNGMSTISAFGHQERFSALNMQLLDANVTAFFHRTAVGEWLGLRMELMGASVLGLVGIMLVLGRESIRSGQTGMVLSYGLTLSTSLYYVVFNLLLIETNMVSAERLQQYSSLPAEATSPSEPKLADNWLVQGAIAFRDVSVRYRPSLPRVLKGVTLRIQPSEKLGIVGRTGSGKSTMVGVLFRLVEPCEGSVTIDGRDTASMSLTQLRSALSIIPQEATLFEGSLRNNLDPLGIHDDGTIWEAVQRCQLGDRLRAGLPESVLDQTSGDTATEILDSPVADGGDNFSVGQRQLLCLVRVLLRRRKVLVLDEATASVDSLSDAIIQKAVVQAFDGCTIMSIAHRIPTIIGFDRVLVMDAGQAAELASPRALLENPSSIFSGLVAEYKGRGSHAVSLNNLDKCGFRVGSPASSASD